MINEYIKELISNNSRVIIPDFGAFMIQNSDNGKIISFNDFLKFNDGVLVNKIIVNEHIDATQSKEQIKKYVKEIEAVLKNGDKFLIDGVGYLSKGSNGDIVFEQSDDTAPAPKKAKPAAKKTAAKTTAPKTEEVADTPKAESAAQTPAPEKKDDGSNMIEVESSKIEPGFQNTTTTANTTTLEPITLEPKKEINVNQTNSTYTQSFTTQKNMEIKTKNKTLNIVLIVVSALIIIGAIVWAVINFNLIGRFRPAQQPETPVIVDTLPAVDTVAVDSVEVEPVAEPVVEEPAVDNSSYFYIIAGSFQNPAYAESFEQQMKNAGFDARTVRNGSFYCVGLKRFATEREAYNELNIMTAENPNLWVLFK